MDLSSPEFDLPEELIQRIQSLLGPTHTSITQKLNTEQLKEAARTCILSKSWYSAWSNRPNLILKHRLNFSLESLQRYKENLGMKLQSLELRLKYGEIKGTHKTLADKLIVESLSLGLNELHVTYFNCPDYLKMRLPRREYMLPAQVFETTTLTKLFARHCLIDSARGGRVLCSRLVSLNLHGSFIDPDVLADILLVCGPSIQNLVLDISFSPCLIV